MNNLQLKARCDDFVQSSNTRFRFGEVDSCAHSVNLTFLARVFFLSREREETSEKEIGPPELNSQLLGIKHLRVCSREHSEKITLTGVSPISLLLSFFLAS